MRTFPYDGVRVKEDSDMPNPAPSNNDLRKDYTEKSSNKMGKANDYNIPAPSSLEEELDADFEIEKAWGQNSKLVAKLSPHAKSQLKQLILKEKLRAVLEMLPKRVELISTGGEHLGRLMGYNQAITEIEQSARKRYQS